MSVLRKLGLLGAIAQAGCGTSAELPGYTRLLPAMSDYDASAPTSDAGMASLDAASQPDTWVNNGPVGLHVVGNQIEDTSGKKILLHGVNRSGTEYKCLGGAELFDGPGDESSVAAIAGWHGVNAVRVPLNESCWLGINGVPSVSSGATYKNAIVAYVSYLHKYGLIPILDLHWVAPGAAQATGQLPMPDADHAAAFWTDVAMTFATDTGVVFDPFNEPFPDSNRDTNAAWQCWKDGCMSNLVFRTADGGPPPTYQSVGMQGLVSAIRATNATNLIVLGGIQFSNGLTQWLAFQPSDPLNNLAAAWHVYNSSYPCTTEACYNGAPLGVAAKVPLIATEIGEDDCGAAFVTPLMQWLDTNANGYLAWSWNAFGSCVPNPMDGGKDQPYSLIGDYSSGTPNGPYAQAIHDHIAALP